MNAAEALVSLERVERHLAEMECELAELRGGPPCEKCSTHAGDVIIGRSGEETRLVGGYEAVLCRACRNAWTVVADESGHWLEYHKAIAREKIAWDSVKIAQKTRTSYSLEASAVDNSVEELIAVERKLFQLAAKWLAS